ncbi:PREDICTED: uncharacterized protein LOC109485209, partial [Branchiostoma belcheri]|uniref:Uncharacterized protein LOC109485209 n=1 Tax=Branchiostoma belcheri TaxID=7741 RepID=A0A6P5AD31_BRABE
VISMLNAMGLASSYKAAWNFLATFAEKQRSNPPLDSTKPWVLFFDNVNILKRVGHVRMGKQNEMYNWTSRLAVEVENEDKNASREPQGRRQDLSPADILVNSDDIQDLQDRFTQKVKAVLVEHFPSLEKFKDTLRKPSSPFPVKKSVVIPLPLEDKDESKKADTIEILLTFAKELNLRDCMKDQAVVGDQASCKNVRGARGWRLGEEDPVERLDWAKESPGDFHFLWEALRTATLSTWGLPTEVGSLSQIRVTINRTRVDKGCKNFALSDEFLCHAATGHLVAALASFLGLATPDDPYNCTSSDEFEQLATTFVTDVVFPGPWTEDSDQVRNRARLLLYMGLLYMDLRTSIRYQMGETVIQHWKLWFELFLGSKRSQYACEAANLLANLKADWSPYMAHLHTHNRCVNISGQEGRAKPVDMLGEHYNRIIKTTCHSSGGRLQFKHAQDISLAVQVFDAAKQFTDGLCRSGRSSSHTTTSATEDIKAITKMIIQHGVHTETAGRNLKWSDPRAVARERINDDKWLVNYLNRGAEPEDDEPHTPGDQDDPDAEEDIQAAAWEPGLMELELS